MSAAVLIVVSRMCTSDGAVPRVAHISSLCAIIAGALNRSAGQAAGCLSLRLAQLQVLGQKAPAFHV